MASGSASEPTEHSNLPRLRSVNCVEGQASIDAAALNPDSAGAIPRCHHRMLEWAPRVPSNINIDDGLSTDLA